jgi:N-acetylmuramoyl-L-alanine amidase
MTRVLGLKLTRVVLDPGHGGHDHGTTGRAGAVEKEVVLDVAMRLGKLIEERLGAEVVYTRTSDTFLSLEDRTRIANEQRADLFLSIHANSSPYRGASGAETYYLSFTASKADMEVAARENAGSQRSMHELSDLLRQIALQDKAAESREFAAKVQATSHELAVQAHGKIRNRGVKKAPFVVLVGAQMPSILTEIGFVSNAREEALLQRPDHRQKIAEALYKGVYQYSQTLSHFSVASRASAATAQ